MEAALQYLLISNKTEFLQKIQALISWKNQPKLHSKTQLPLVTHAIFPKQKLSTNYHMDYLWISVATIALFYITKKYILNKSATATTASSAEEPRNVKLIRETFNSVKDADAFAKEFYGNMFTDYPEVVPLFKNVSIDLQRKMLMKSLVVIVNEQLTDLSKLCPYLKAMGKRHVAYKVEEKHYPFVGNSLIKTLKAWNKNIWTQEHETAWTDAYALITKTMLEGANE